MNSFSAFRLDGRVALVTGGGRGLGFAITQALAEAGARVAIAEVNPELCAQAQGKLREQGHEALGIVTDVTNRRSVDAAVEQVAREWSDIDVLVNNVGAGYRRQDNWPTPASIPFELVTEENWRLVQDINLTSVFHCCQAVGKSMLEKGRGTIVNVASISGMVGNIKRHNASYCAAKAGVIMLTRQVASSWASKGVRVNAIAPGYMRSEMGIPALEDPNVRELLPVMTPMGRAGQPHELGGAAIYLASDASSFMTGQCLVVDGGYTLW
ncbi:MAG: hypothetical protein RIS88_668 [Pseudomonadota bacterium]|jgi:NAD(P)-dependent dehydrogenase (short-subunit alcohol dehydrogenase family)